MYDNANYAIVIIQNQNYTIKYICILYSYNLAKHRYLPTCYFLIRYVYYIQILIFENLSALIEHILKYIGNWIFLYHLRSDFGSDIDFSFPSKNHRFPVNR